MMTTHIQIPDVSPVIQATGDGSQKVFSFPFPIFWDSDLEVRVGSAVLMTGYTVFGAGSSKGGAVVFAGAPAAGSRVTLRRKQTYARTDDFLDERAPTPHELNDAIDENVAAIQELAEQASRAVQLPLSADLSQPLSLDLPSPEANKVLGWNGAANALVNIAQIDPSNVLHRDQNLADLTDAAAARANLGLGSAATHADSDFATAAQGAKADSALQTPDIGSSVQAHDADLDWLAANLSSAGKALIDDADASAQRVTLGLSPVAASGSYTDLSNKPTLGTAAALDVGTGANQVVELDANAKLPAVDGSQLTNIAVGKVQTDGTDAVGYLQDKLAAGANISVTKVADTMTVAVTGLAAVATSGSYTDLSNKPALGTATALNVDTDATLAADSDSLLPSQKAVKAYALPKSGGALTGAINEALGSDIASATTTDIGAATGNFLTVTGAATITSLGTVQAGTRRMVKFAGTATLIYNATGLILPGSASITTATGDIAEFVSLGSGNWICTSYQRASGLTLVTQASSAFEVAQTITPTSGTSIDIIDLDPAYDYEFQFDGLTNNGGPDGLFGRLGTNNTTFPADNLYGNSYVGGGTNAGQTGPNWGSATGNDNFILLGETFSGITRPNSARLYLSDLGSVSYKKGFFQNVYCHPDNGYTYNFSGAFVWQNSAAVTALRVYSYNSYMFTGGSIIVRRMKRS